MYLTDSANRRAEDIFAKGLSGKDAQKLMKENQELRNQLMAMEGELDRMQRIYNDYNHLYGPIPFGQWEVIPARVVTADSLPYGQERWVNAGHREGAQAGAGVTTRRLLTDRSKALPPGLATIAGSTLVGRLTSAGAFTARLQLVTDEAFSLRGLIQRNIDGRLITITSGMGATETPLTQQNDYPVYAEAAGDGRGGLVIRDVNAYHHVKPGDYLLAAGDDAFMPARIVVGVVSEVIDDPKRKGLFVEVRVKPLVDLESLREVYLVVPAALQNGEGR